MLVQVLTVAAGTVIGELLLPGAKRATRKISKKKGHHGHHHSHSHSHHDSSSKAVNDAVAKAAKDAGMTVETI